VGMSIQDFYSSVVNICKYERVDDNNGNWHDEQKVVYANVPCCIQPRKGDEVIAHNKIQLDGTHVMYCDIQTKPIPSSYVVVQGEVIFNILNSRNIDQLGRFLTINLQEVV